MPTAADHPEHGPEYTGKKSSIAEKQVEIFLHVGFAPANPDERLKD